MRNLVELLKGDENLRLLRKIYGRRARIETTGVRTGRRVTRHGFGRHAGSDWRHRIHHHAPIGLGGRRRSARHFFDRRDRLRGRERARRNDLRGRRARDDRGLGSRAARAGGGDRLGGHGIGGPALRARVRHRVARGAVRGVADGRLRPSRGRVLDQRLGRGGRLARRGEREGDQHGQQGDENDRAPPSCPPGQTAPLFDTCGFSTSPRL
jgi:hypothetical protein